MTEEERRAEWLEFLGRLPVAARVDLNAPNAADAFHKARVAGWDLDSLVSDVLSTYARKQGAAIAITRLRALADTSPVEPERKPLPRFVSENVERIPARWAAARMALVHSVRSEGLSSDEADLRMRSLIALQKAEVADVGF